LFQVAWFSTVLGSEPAHSQADPLHKPTHSVVRRPDGSARMHFLHKLVCHAGHHE
jgi:hypothetical protein